MKNKKLNMYTLVAILAVILHIISVFYFFVTTEMTLFIAVLLVLATPVIFVPIYGIGKIITLLEASTDFEEMYDDITYYSQELNDEDIVDDVENEQIEIEETKTTKENAHETDENTTNNTQDELEKEKDSNSKESEEDNKSNEKYEPEIKKNKIRCVYCGTFNNMKKDYCFICGKKIKK